MKKESNSYNEKYNVIGFDPIRCECKTITMCNLKNGKKTIFELQRLMPAISFELINFKLQQLEDQGLIYKAVNYAYPAKVQYGLTCKGWQCLYSLKEYVDVDSLVG